MGISAIILLYIFWMFINNFMRVMKMAKKEHFPGKTIKNVNFLFFFIV